MPANNQSVLLREQEEIYGGLLVNTNCLKKERTEHSPSPDFRTQGSLNEFAPTLIRHRTCTVGFEISSIDALHLPSFI